MPRCANRPIWPIRQRRRAKACRAGQRRRRRRPRKRRPSEKEGAGLIVCGWTEEVESSGVRLKQSRTWPIPPPPTEFDGFSRLGFDQSPPPTHILPLPPLPLPPPPSVPSAQPSSATVSAASGTMLSPTIHSSSSLLLRPFSAR